ncbi:hypothetical protein KSP40_PGU017797 [Platanthera guangdongensis]|uniref:BFN domain-containing protein n=1 Tax=Platanthera guangdongensis TaxID=2320717 RepID=A0ABR2MNC6_9ASPA
MLRSSSEMLLRNRLFPPRSPDLYSSPSPSSLSSSALPGSDQNPSRKPRSLIFPSSNSRASFSLYLNRYRSGRVFLRPRHTLHTFRASTGNVSPGPGVRGGDEDNDQYLQASLLVPGFTSAYPCIVFLSRCCITPEIAIWVLPKSQVEKEGKNKVKGKKVVVEEVSESNSGSKDAGDQVNNEPIHDPNLSTSSEDEENLQDISIQVNLDEADIRGERKGHYNRGKKNKKKKGASGPFRSQGLRRLKEPPRPALPPAACSNPDFPLSPSSTPIPRRFLFLRPLRIQIAQFNVHSIGHGFLQRFQSPTVFLKIACAGDLLLPIIVGEFAIIRLIDAITGEETEECPDQFQFVNNIVRTFGYEVRTSRC